MAALWRRDNYVVGGGAGEIALIALSSTKLPDPLPVSRTRHGMPDDGGGADAVALVARDRSDDPAWFTEQVVAPFADLIASDLGAFRAMLGEAPGAGALVPPEDVDRLAAAITDSIGRRPTQRPAHDVMGWAEIGGLTRAVYERAIRDHAEAKR